MTNHKPGRLGVALGLSAPKVAHPRSNGLKMKRIIISGCLALMTRILVKVDS
jgi:hypothetical protein